MPRFFINAPLPSGDTITLPAEVAQHARVLRLQAGGAITLFNGTGGQYQASIVSMGKRDVQVRIEAFCATEAEPPYSLTLAQGIAENSKMDWLTEKAVELGAARIVPLTTTRSVVRLTGERTAKRQAHWQRIVQAACEQCGRNRLPEVAPVQDFHAWLDAMPEALVDNETRILLSPRADMAFNALPQQAPQGRVIVLVGPEGGLLPEEEALAQARGFIAIGLGPRILRTETAGIALLAALAARWGGW